MKPTVTTCPPWLAHAPAVPSGQGHSSRSSPCPPPPHPQAGPAPPAALGQGRAFSQSMPPQACSGLHEPTEKEPELQSSTWPRDTFRAPTTLLILIHPHTSFCIRINFIIVFSKTILQYIVLYPYAFCKCNTKK